MAIIWKIVNGIIAAIIGLLFSFLRCFAISLPRYLFAALSSYAIAQFRYFAALLRSLTVLRSRSVVPSLRISAVAQPRSLTPSLRRCPVIFLVPALLLMLMGGCSESYTPKPRGYFRLDMPEKEYQVLDSAYPYTFEYPVYADITADSSKMAEPYWINIRYKPFRATLHLSYKVINGNLAKYLNDAHTLVNKHIPKANAITQREFIDRDHHVYGLVYNIRGADAASSYQFYVTDSLTKFVRGALYFNMVPNNDSLAPVIDFLTQDMEHMINTFRWKNIK